MGATMANFLPFPTYVQGTLLLSEGHLYSPCHLILGGLPRETFRLDTLWVDDFHDFGRF